MRTRDRTRSYEYSEYRAPSLHGSRSSQCSSSAGPSKKGDSKKGILNWHRRKMDAETGPFSWFSPFPHSTWPEGWKGPCPNHGHLRNKPWQPWQPWLRIPWPNAQPPLCCRRLPAHPMLLTLRSSLEKSLFCTNNTQECTGMYRTKCAENVLRWHLQVSKTVGTQRMGNVLGDAGNSQLMDVDGTFRYHQPGHQPLKPVPRRDQGCQCQSCSKVCK